MKSGGAGCLKSILSSLMLGSVEGGLRGAGATGASVEHFAASLLKKSSTTCEICRFNLQGNMIVLYFIISIFVIFIYFNIRGANILFRFLDVLKSHCSH